MYSHKQGTTLGFTTANKTFCLLDEHVWTFMGGWKVLLKSFDISVVANVNGHRVSVDLQVIATNTESSVPSPSASL